MNAGLGNMTVLKRHLLAGGMTSDQQFDTTILEIGLGVAAMMEGATHRSFWRVENDTVAFQLDRSAFVLPRFPIEQITKAETRAASADSWVEQAGFVQNWSPLSGVVYLPETGADPGKYYTHVRFTFTGGYWWEELDPDEEGYPSARPAGAAALPNDLRMAWLMQCRAVWSKIDKLGTGLVDKPDAQAAMGDLDLIPLVKRVLSDYTIMQPI